MPKRKDRGEDEKSAKKQKYYVTYDKIFEPLNKSLKEIISLTKMKKYCDKKYELRLDARYFRMILSINGILKKLLKPIIAGLEYHMYDLSINDNYEYGTSNPPCKKHITGLIKAFNDAIIRDAHVDRILPLYQIDTAYILENIKLEYKTDERAIDIIKIYTDGYECVLPALQYLKQDCEAKILQENKDYRNEMLHKIVQLLRRLYI